MESENTLESLGEKDELYRQYSVLLRKFHQMDNEEARLFDKLIVQLNIDYDLAILDLNTINQAKHYETLILQSQEMSKGEPFKSRAISHAQACRKDLKAKIRILQEAADSFKETTIEANAEAEKARSRLVRLKQKHRCLFE